MAQSQSIQEVLDQLIAELRNLKPDARSPKFEIWRTRAEGLMVELFGARGRLTVDLRDVSFAPDFEEGRARALALLKAAASLTTALSASGGAAAPARPASRGQQVRPVSSPTVPSSPRQEGAASEQVAATQESTAAPAGETPIPPAEASPAGPPETVEPKSEPIVHKLDTSGTRPPIPEERIAAIAHEAVARRSERRQQQRRRSVWPVITAALLVVIIAGGLSYWFLFYKADSPTTSSTQTTVAANTSSTTGTATSVADSTTTTTAYNPAAVQVADAANDPRIQDIVDLVKAGIVQLKPNAQGQAYFQPNKFVQRGEFLAWLDRVQDIPTGSGGVPSTLYYDLSSALRDTAIDAYQNRIILDWPSGDAKIAFNPTEPLLARDAEAWAARMIIRLVPGDSLATALDIKKADAFDLRNRISTLKPEELNQIVDGFKLRPAAGWAKKDSITRSEVAEFLMNLKAVFQKYPAAA